jgi:hypothetical protein
MGAGTAVPRLRIRCIELSVPGCRCGASPERGSMARSPILPSARMRPTEQQWSTLEYACHVRDVFRLFDKRLELMVENDDPLFENWDQDRTAVESRYEEQDPERVAAELQAAAAALAERFDAVAQSSWSRTGRRSDGAEFTVDSFSRYLLHDPVHHLHDVNTGLHVLGETA